MDLNEVLLYRLCLGKHLFVRVIVRRVTRSVPLESAHFNGGFQLLQLVLLGVLQQIADVVECQVEVRERQPAPWILPLQLVHTPEDESSRVCALSNLLFAQIFLQLANVLAHNAVCLPATRVAKGHNKPALAGFQCLGDHVTHGVGEEEVVRVVAGDYSVEQEGELVLRTLQRVVDVDAGRLLRFLSRVHTEVVLFQLVFGF